MSESIDTTVNLEDPSKRSLIIKNDGTFTLFRKTRPDIRNDNGVVYSKEEFDRAMEVYVKKQGGRVYLAPVIINSGYDNKIIRKINTEVYRKFNEPPKIEYSVGNVHSWDDFTITCKYRPSSTTEKLINTVLEKSKINIRYYANIDSKGIAHDMKIDCVDIASIPFDILGIDIEKYKR